MKHIIKHFFSKKRNIWITIGVAAVLLIGGFMIFGNKGPNAGMQTGSVVRQDLQETVLATGQVVSGTDLNLSFAGSGVVRGITVKEGDTVRKGQLLAYLDQASAQASLTTAKGSLAQAQANYDKLVAGATAANLKTYENSVTAAEQDLTNAYNGALNTLNSAYSAMFNAHSVVVSVQNSYFSNPDQQGLAVTDARNDINAKKDQVKVLLDRLSFASSTADIDVAIAQMSLNLNAVYNDIGTVRTQTDQGIYYQKVSSTDKDSLDAQKSLVNTAAVNISSLEHAIASYKVALQKAKDQLALVKSPPTQAEINLAQAQILSAQGQVAAAQAQISNASIVAPSAGVITDIKIKTGELAGAMSAVITLQDVGDLHTEADVSEANIASLQVGQAIDYTFDALGPDKHFTGAIVTINPSSTVISGIVNYKITGNLENIPNVKPGMTVNMAILTASRASALSVPSTAVVNKNNGSFVRVIDDAKKGTFHEVQVQTGLQADGGLVEIISGLAENQQIVTYLK